MAEKELASKEDHTFAAARSNKAAEIAYDLAKAVSQTCLLINGAAASALVAYLTKGSVAHGLYTAITYGIALYGAGTAASALMMFFMMQTADNWNYAWYSIVFPNEIGESDDYQNLADRWHNAFYLAFCVAIICFLVACGVVAFAFLRATLPPGCATIS